MGTVDYAQVYLRDPDRYDAMVSAEDHDGALPALLAAVAPLPVGARALELGVGTGRVTRLLLRAGASVRGCEQAAPMLAVARARLRAEGYSDDRLDLVVGDAYALDFDASWADLAVAGWVFGHAVSWHPDDWPSRIGHALTAMRRALKPGGRLVVIETLGTGCTEPAPPPGLIAYQAWLEREWGLTRHTIRTDYQYESVEAAAAGMGFFFGDAMVERVRANHWSRVPECTGVWVG
ncbi:MAG: Transcriptional regulator, ArsR family / Methyltransferase fusion [Myxococcaceae bacterium]|nr:Transcriptional regulator, ArsR family / Methyltransferase fusion [Myxococcaceae bacterium]